MTPAERDEVRRIAAETIDAHTLRHSQTGATLPCACGSCLAARAVLRYVPPGCAADPAVTSAPSQAWGRAISVAACRRVPPREAQAIAHAIHAAADAAEES